MKEHPVFPKLENENTKIWRYMNFTKFVSLLDTKSLFFSRSDKLGDPFEGSVSKANVNLRPTVYPGIPEMTLNQSSEYAEKLRFHTYLNCWHMNEDESVAMWKIYAKNNTGIAIQSTYQRLVDVLKDDDEVYIGAVNYIDYVEDWLPEGFASWQYVHKQNSFKYENELRAVIQKIPHRSKGTDINIPGPLGINISIKIENLIEDIYISPTSPEWFHSLINSILEKYEWNKKAIFSKLSNTPVY